MSEYPHRSLPDEKGYRYLEGASRRQLAWEWLRRDQDYRRLAPSARHKTAEGMMIVEPAPVACRECWGCVFVEDARLSFPEISMLWDPCLDPSVLRVEAHPAEDGASDLFNLENWASNSVLVAGGQGDEHLLLRYGHHHVHLHVIAGTLLEGQVALRFDIGWSDRVDHALGTLRRFLLLHRFGELRSGGGRSDRIAPRAIVALRVYDALGHGASIRDIGIMLFGRDRVDAEWRDPGESLKSQCRRLISRAQRIADGGYKDLLRQG